MFPLLVIYEARTRLQTFVVLLWAWPGPLTPHQNSIWVLSHGWQESWIDIWKHEITVMLHKVCVKYIPTHIHLIWNEIFTEKCCIDMVWGVSVCVCVCVCVWVIVKLYRPYLLVLFCKGRLFVCCWYVEYDSFAKYSSCLPYFLGNIIRKAKPIEFRVLHISSALSNKSL